MHSHLLLPRYPAAPACRATSERMVRGSTLISQSDKSREASMPHQLIPFVLSSNKLSENRVGSKCVCTFFRHSRRALFTSSHRFLSWTRTLEADGNATDCKHGGRLNNNKQLYLQGLDCSKEDQGLQRSASFSSHLHPLESKTRRLAPSYNFTWESTSRAGTAM